MFYVYIEMLHFIKTIGCTEFELFVCKIMLTFIYSLRLKQYTLFHIHICWLLFYKLHISTCKKNKLKNTGKIQINTLVTILKHLLLLLCITCNTKNYFTYIYTAILFMKNSKKFKKMFLRLFDLFRPIWISIKYIRYVYNLSYILLNNNFIALPEMFCKTSRATKFCLEAINMK